MRCQRCPRRHPVDVGAGRSGGIGVAGSNRRRGSQFYVLLPDGVQKISSFVADLPQRELLRGGGAAGGDPDVLVHTTQVTSLPVEYYPAGRLNFVDTAADPTTCVSWEKASTDPQARVAVYNGRGLPVPPSMDSRIVRLVRDDRAPASVVATQVLVLPGAANFVTSTSGVITAESRESLFWVSGNGVRFGIANDEATLRALGLDPGAAVQAPWPLLRTFAAGPALSRDAALLARGTLPTLGQVAIVTTTAKAGAEMSKKAFPINRVNIDPPKPVRVAPNPPIALPEREPRNIWVMIGVPALIVALIGTIVMLYVSGVRSLATGFFPLMGIGAFSMLAFSGRFGRARKITWGELEKGRRRYLRDLDTNRDEIQTAVCAQREWQNAVHSDPPGLGAIIGGPRMWERGRGDVDFLEVRVGTGVQHAPDSVLSVTWPDISSDEELEPVTGQALRDFILEQRKIRDIAKVVNLRSAPGFSFVSEDLDRVRSLMRSVLCSLAVFHNPRDVKLMVVTRNPEVWAWMVWLPHNLHDELFDACGWRRLIFATPEELEAALGAELHMKGKRGAWTPPTVASPTAMGSALETGQVGVDLGPHLVIVDDNTGSPDAWESVVGQVGKAGLTVLRIASRVGTGVGFAEDQVFEMAQRHGAATAVKAGRDGADADDDQRPAPLLRARGTFFAHADQLSIHRAYRYARAMARWSPTSRSEVTDSTSGAAELLRSLGISDPRELDVDRLWAERRGRGDDRWCEIPVGAKPNGELQNIILRAKDFGGFGFHSVVIGT
ncbi:type VII secretion protein EccB, partial [Mycobacterium tuberculosis]